jgi:choline dehydrogenase-like flavoprotein
MCTSIAAEHVYTMTDRYDVIVVGSRADGGTLVHTLAPSGKKSCSWSAATSCSASWRTGTPMRCSSTAGTSPPTPIAGVAHQAGTARLGSDPLTSVSDINCKAHELDNLYFADASIFSSIGAVNPALTANPIRVGDHIAGRLR